MKTFLFVATALAAVISVSAAPDACCAAAPKPACCSEAETSAALSAHSLYQLDAHWTTDAGATTSLAEFRGQPVVIAMFFAQCEYACPILVRDMQKLRDTLPAEARAKTRFVLVSFDTKRDTVDALRTYRNRAGLDEAWTLLRGDSTDVQELAALLGVKFKQDARGQFSHSNLITVLNSEGEIASQRSGLQGDLAGLARAIARN
jgi:protein SCO1/2